MSSIFGIWRQAPGLDPEHPPLAARASSMERALSAYGTARSFRHLGPEIALGGNLSGFLPEDRFDAQPLLSPDGLSVLVADVRLDNRADLIHKLHLPAPDRLADSAILSAAWQRWGPECLPHLIGVFAFAVWNPRTQELFLARDQTGERPLFYHAGPDFFAFSSMPKGLLALPGVEGGVNESTLLAALTLAQYDQGVSFFRSISRLPPGHSLHITRSGATLNRYWRPFQVPAPRFRRDEDYAEAFLEIFDAATAARLRSTGPIGSQLSSGLDSSSVTASAAIQLATRGQGLTSFTAVPRPGFLGQGWHGRLPDEGPGAAEVARMYPNVDHVLVHSAGQPMVPILTRLTDALDEPVPNAVNALWIDAILQAARRRGINTMLVGVRGNLTFSHSGLEALGQMLRRGRWLQLARTAHSFRQKGLISFRTSAARAFTGVLPDGLHRRLFDAGSFDLTYSAVNPDLAARLNLKERMLEQFFSNRHDVQADRLALFQTYDVDMYNTAHQAVHGIDLRDPTADLRVLDFCFSLPIEQYVAGGVPRSLARRSMRARLPGTTLTRTLRGQQGADWYLTVADALPALRDQAALNRTSPAARRMLDLPRMDALLETWPIGGYEQQQTSLAWGDALCRGFTFGYFLRSHEAPEVHPGPEE